jgi:hypothetical protein
MKLALLIAALLLNSVAMAATAPAGPPLSEGDKAEILRSILLRTNFLGEGERSRTVYLSTEHIPAPLLKVMPAVDGVKFVLMTPAEIEEKAKTGFVYYSFSDFEVKGGAVRVSFFKAREVSAAGFMSYAGLRYEYRKVKGKWKGKIYSYPLGMT